MSESSYLLVDEKVLPEVFSKVIEVKRRLEEGTAQNTSEAVRAVGISRSVFYKYRDYVFPYSKSDASSIMTIQALLVDRPGVLMSMLSVFYDAKVNVLTVNQNIPTGGRASVSVSVRTGQMTGTVDLLLSNLLRVEGVLKIESISEKQ